MHDSRTAWKKRSQKVHDVGRTNEAIATINNSYGCVLPDVSAAPIASGSQLRSTSSNQLPGVWRLRPFSKSRPRKPMQRFSDHLPHGDGGPLKYYITGTVSLPDDVAGSPFVTSVWGGQPGDMARFYMPSDVIKRRV